MTTLFAAFRDRLLVCTADGDSGRSEDVTWRTVERLEGHSVESVAVSSEEPDRIFVGTFGDGLYQSTDRGESFDRLETEFVDKGIDADDDYEGEAVTALAISPHDPATVYAGMEPSRLYCSTDAGDTWTELGGLIDLSSADEWYFPPRPHTHHVRWIEVDPVDSDRLYVGIEAGAFVLSPDGGETWKERPPGSRRDNHTLATHSDRRGRIYAAAGDGFAVSDDGGESWEAPRDGLEHTYCWGLAVDPGDPDRVLLSSASGARTAHWPDRAESYVYRREGDSPWTRLDGRVLPMGDGVVRSVFVTGEVPESVYAVNNRGVFYSTDFGDSWDRLEVGWNEEFETMTPRGCAVID